MPRREGLEIENMAKSEFVSRLESRAFEKRIPFKATMELTYGCNLRCVHCYNPTHKAKGELSTQEFYRIIDQLAQEGCFLITFTGGRCLRAGTHLKSSPMPRKRALPSCFSPTRP